MAVLTDIDDPNSMPKEMRFTITVNLEGIRKDIEYKISSRWKEALEGIVNDNIDVHGHELTNKVMTEKWPDGTKIKDNEPPEPEPPDYLMMKGWLCRHCGETIYMTGGPPKSCPYHHVVESSGFKDVNE